jgi:hypothetical protein
MKATFRIQAPLLEQIHADLSRPHAFAKERVGFISCRVAGQTSGVALLATHYHPVDDGDYEDDPRVGAMMGEGAIRKALEYAYNQPVSMVHVHRHDHEGTPGFSRVDLTESAKFVPAFWHVRPTVPHGALVLSHDAMYGYWWNPQDKRSRPITELSVIGFPLRVFRYGDG